MGGVSENMFPGGSNSYSADCLNSYCKELSDSLVLPAEPSQFSDTPDLCLVELGVPVPGAAENNAPTLSVHVCCVLFSGTEEEMRGIATRRIIAAMADAQPGGDISVRQSPANAAGYLLERMSLPTGEQAVALGSDGPCPEPTRIDFACGDAAPKPALVLHVVNAALDHLANVTDGARDGKD